MEKRVVNVVKLAFNLDTSDLNISKCVPSSIDGWDSLGYLNLITLLEEEFNTSFNLEEIASMTNGGEDMLKVIEMRVTNENDQ